MINAIDGFEKNHKEVQSTLLNILQHSNSVIDLKAIATLLKQEKQNDNNIYIGKERFKERVEKINQKIQKMVM